MARKRRREPDTSPESSPPLDPSPEGGAACSPDVGCGTPDSSLAPLQRPCELALLPRAQQRAARPIKWAAARKKRRRQRCSDSPGDDLFGDPLSFLSSLSSEASLVEDRAGFDASLRCSQDEQLAMIDVTAEHMQTHAAPLATIFERMQQDIGSSVSDCGNLKAKRVLLAVATTCNSVAGCLVYERRASARRMVACGGCESLGAGGRGQAEPVEGASSLEKGSESSNSLTGSPCSDGSGGAPGVGVEAGRRPAGEGWETEVHYASRKDRCTGCLLGVAHIWVDPTFRRKGIASAMLDGARGALVYGYSVPLGDVAFSQPSAEGKLLACAYAGRRDFLVYTME